MVELITQYEGRTWQREPHYLEEKEEKKKANGTMIAYDFENWCFFVENMVLTRAGDMIQLNDGAVNDFEELKDDLEEAGYIGRKQNNSLVDIYKDEGRKHYVGTISIMGLDW